MTIERSFGTIPLPRIGSGIFGLCWVVIGLQHFLHPDVLVDLVPSYLWNQKFWVFTTGFGMIISGVCLITNLKVRLAHCMLFLMLSLIIINLHVPLLAEKMTSSFRWTRACEDMALLSILLQMMGNTGARKVGLALYTISLIYLGIVQMMDLAFVPVPVEVWIPGKVFWTLLLGISMVMGSISLWLNKAFKSILITQGILMFIFILLRQMARNEIGPDPLALIITMISVQLAAGTFILYTTPRQTEHQAH